MYVEREILLLMNIHRAVMYILVPRDLFSKVSNVSKYKLYDVLLYVFIYTNEILDKTMNNLMVY